jgi:ABC-2 type transport system ATP-binding protein
MNKILELKNVTKEYDDFKIDNISFSLEKGYVMGFIGPNGAGKTTTIKLIMNLLKMKSGSINIFGLDSVKDEKEIKNRIGFVYETNIYSELMSIEKTAKLIAPFYTDWSWDAFNKYTDSFGIDKKKKLRKLSKGMLMKCALAIALSHNADLLLLDEPTSGLDPIARNELLEILYSIIQDENKSILFSTHITSDLEKISDYLTFINEGKILFSEKYKDIIEKYKLIKLPKDLYSEIDKKDLIGERKCKFGVEALSGEFSKLQKKFGEKIVVENPNIEDIMIYLSQNKVEG